MLWLNILKHNSPKPETSLENTPSHPYSCNDLTTIYFKLGGQLRALTLGVEIGQQQYQLCWVWVSIVSRIGSWTGALDIVVFGGLVNLFYCGWGEWRASSFEVDQVVDLYKQ